MAKYHVNPDSGESGECGATRGQCPFGGENHFDSQAEATAAGEVRLAAAYSAEPLRKARPEVSREAAMGLIDELHLAAEAYYQRGEDSGLSDDEFDAKQAYLQEVYDGGLYDDLFTTGSRGFNLLEADPSLGTASEDNVITHRVPMLSLAKAKKEAELYSFLDKARASGARDFRLQAKLDGLALAVEYRGGKIFCISTRGDGVHGEDVTYVLKDPKVTVKGLELTIDRPGLVEVRGELFFTNQQFQDVDDRRHASTGVRFKNSRNSVTGLLKAANDGVRYDVEFTFAAYSVLENDVPASMDLVHELGFRSVDAITDEATGALALQGYATNQELMTAVDSFGKLRLGFDFPTDGVVIKPTNEAAMHEAMGYTSHHPASQVAWKYPAEVATTEVLAVSVTVGSSGKLTPVAHVRPVNLDGSTVSNASLHNFNLVRTKGIRVGSIVLVEKANEIIPQVKAVLSSPEDSFDIEVPTECPSCQSKLVFDEKEAEYPPRTLRCANVDCESRNFFALKMAVGKGYMDIDGLSEVSLEYLNATGRVKNIADLYTLELQELADSGLGETSTGGARRLGEKRAQNILNHIEKSKTRPLSKMLPAISIEGMGAGSTKKLEKRFGDIDGILAASQEEIATVDGLGPISARKIYEGLRLRRPLIDRMREAGVTFGKVEPAEATSAGEIVEASTVGSIVPSTSVDLSGKSFAISGAVPPGYRNRGEWVDYVEACGGEFHSGPKAHTTYMIGDPTDTSAKAKAAVKHGVTFITPEGFSEMFGSA